MEKNKKKVLIIIGIVISLLLFIFPIIFLVRVTIVGVGSLLGNNSKPITNSEEVEKKVSMIQNIGYATSFSTEEGDETRNLTHIKIWPTVNLNHMDKITELTVKNIKVEGNKKGEAIVIKPGHVSMNLDSYNYIWGPMDDIVQSKDLEDSGRTLKYSVVESAEYYDEVSSRGTSLPYFLIIIKDLGTFNYRAIMDSTNHFYSAKVLEYAGVTADDINITISFDIEMKFEDGTKYVKRFSGLLDGATMMRDDGQNIEFTY
jgi:hypothetical protein